MTLRRLMLLGAIMAAPLLISAQPKDSARQQARATEKNSAVEKQASETDGERVFKQNCSRCHNAPEGFSPRISGTIVRHMRVRANLSDQDVRAILRFFNP